MLGAMSGWFSLRPFSKEAMVACTAVGLIKTSVLPHHTMTIRAAPLSFLNLFMSSMSCRARSILVLPFLRCFPFRFLTYFLLNTAGMGFNFCSVSFNSSTRSFSRTPAFRAAS